MKEQTKVLILLSMVIIIAVISLIFVFYQYAKIQTQVKTQFAPRVIDQTMLRIENTPITYGPTCQRPNCNYENSYRIGAIIIETENQDINGENIQGCHAQGTQITVKTTQTPCSTQTLTCIAGGWTLASPAQLC